MKAGHFHRLKETIGLTSFLLGLILIGYSIHRFGIVTADPQITPSPNNVLALKDIPTANIFAKACSPTTPTSSIVCKIDSKQGGHLFIDDLAIKNTLYSQMMQYLQTSAQQCAEADQRNRPIQPGDTQVTDSGATCRFTQADLMSDSQQDKYINLKINVPLTSYDLPLASITHGGQSAVDQNVTAIGQVSGTVRMMGTYNIPSKSWQYDLADPENLDLSVIVESFNINSLFTFTLDDKQDFFQHPGLFPADLTLTPNKSSWKASVHGAISADIQATGRRIDKHDFQTSIQKLDLCSNTCSITTTEIQHLNGEVPGKSPKDVQGQVISDVLHSETYTGTASYNPETDVFSWNKDVKVEKIDNRSWQHSLRKGTDSWCYSGKTTAEATDFPYQEEGNHAVSDSTKDLIYESRLAGGPPSHSLNTPNLSCTNSTPSPPDGYGIGAVHVSIHNEQQAASETGVGPFIQSGTGTTTSIYGTTTTGSYDNRLPAFRNCTSSPLISGLDLFGNISSCAGEMVITGEQYPNNPTDHDSDGSLIDPFANLSQFTQSYAEGLKVPGSFTSDSTEAGLTVLSTYPVKVLPKQVALFESFAASDASFRSLSIHSIEQFVMSLRQYGVEVQIVDTSSPQKFMAALGKLQNGSWLINLGHGNPDALITGENDGAHFVTYATMYKILQKKIIHLSVFASGSCYANHAQLAPTVIGSEGDSIEVQSVVDMLGHTIGIGGNNFHQTFTDLESKLSQLIDTSNTCSKNH